MFHDGENAGNIFVPFEVDCSESTHSYSRKQNYHNKLQVVNRFVYFSPLLSVILYAVIWR